jgi:hypothetical protein
MKERVAGTLQPSWTALHVNSHKLASGGAAENGKMVEVEINVVGDHEIDKAIAIVIAKRSAHRPTAIRYPRLFGYIGEGAVGIVVVEDVATVTGYANIGPAIVVIVSDRAAYGEAGKPTPAFSVTSVKAVSVVVIEGSARFLTPKCPLNRRCVGEVDVEPPVTVIIKKKYTATHRFDDVAAFG